jgi:hypothetical protein
VGEGIQAFVHPAHQYFLRAAGDGGHVQVHVASLADAIEAADALFKHVRVEGQVPENQVLRELEVAAFGADFGSDQQARAFRVSEVGGIAIALQQVHVFVETRHGQAAAQAKGFFQRLHLGARAAQQQRLCRGDFIELGQQPVGALVVFVIVLGLVVQVAKVVGELGAQRRGCWSPTLTYAQRQRLQVGDAAGNHRPPRAVADHGAAGAVAVHQVADSASRGSSSPCAIRRQAEAGGRPRRGTAARASPCAGSEFRAREQAIGRVADNCR